MARDADIYGVDDNALAEGIAADCLKPAHRVKAEGAPIDQAARSKGNTPQYENPDAKTADGKGDGRAKSKGN